ncbi:MULTISPECIES: toll/interleukin-1 receptor domain-containing protein [Vibrio]|uniref:toll/interleukin-1 receptor domain-containing protein n=1 Tax=Vibrio TaxID=662 RepID=UPI0027E395EA|nr:TIR domain-containing protein [Vibrio metschnikovii]
MNIERLKNLYVEGNRNMSDLLSWRDSGSFFRWNDKVCRTLKVVLGTEHDDFIKWSKRKFGPGVIFALTTKSDYDQIFQAAAKQAINHLEDIIEECDYIATVTKKETEKNSSTVNIMNHNFDVAFSFPGEVRDYVEETANLLINEIGRNAVFYDNNFKSQLARPSLDSLLQDVYRNRSKLVVVFVCEKYQEKNWCGVEFRAIKEVLFEREFEKIMFVRMDQGKVEGVFNTDGYIDGSRHKPSEVAQFILERLELEP